MNNQAGKNNETPTMSMKGRRHEILFKFNRFMARLDSMLIANAFIVLFMFVYVCANTLMFFWGARDQFKYAKKESYRWFITIARAFGYTLNLNCALVILLASRFFMTVIRDSRLNLLIPFEKVFPLFHIVVGYFIAVAVVFHGAFHLVWVGRWKNWAPGLFGITMSMVTGFVLAAILIVMLVTSMPHMRRTHFKVFHIVHNVGAFIFFVLLLFHGVYFGVPYTYKWIVGPLAIYFIDRIIRYIKIRTSKLMLKDSSCSLKGTNVIRLNISKPFNYLAGHYAELQVRSINRTEWHPFTIASAPEEKDMTFYIKALGDWTKQLRAEFERRINGNEEEPLEVFVRGPFGAPAQHADGYDRIVLISGGIGATPFVSVCKHVFFKMQQKMAIAKWTGGMSTTPDISPKTSENKYSFEKDMNLSPKEYNDADDDEDEDNVEISSAERHLMRGVECAFKSGGDLTRYETWEYAQSTSPISISSPRARTATKPLGRTSHMVRAFSVGGSAFTSPTSVKAPKLGAGITPRSLSENVRHKTVGQGIGATGDKPALPINGDAGRTPRTLNVNISTNSPTTSQASRRLDRKLSPTPNDRKVGRPFGDWQMPRSFDVIGRSFRAIGEEDINSSHDKIVNDVEENVDLEAGADSVKEETTSDSKFRAEFDTHDYETRNSLPSSEGSFAKQTMNIDDGATAAMVRSKAELRLRLRTARFFQSVTVNMGLCILTVSRLVLVAYMHLFHAAHKQGTMKMPGAGDKEAWMTVLDVVLGLMIALTLAVSVLSELLLLRGLFFKKMGRLFDLFVLVPIAAGSNVVSICSLLQGNDHITETAALLHFALCVGGLVLLMMYRLGRVIGSRVKLAKRHRDRGFTKLKAIDFLWTTPTDEEDEWVREELGNFADGKGLRLHRFVTRAKEDYLEHGVKSTKGMITNVGRPDWDEVFMRIAERTPSDGKVGVFFCGPHGMSKAVEEAMMRVQVKTMLRGVYLGTSKDDVIQRQLGLKGAAEVENLRSRGSNIQFAWRKEHFG